MKLPSTPCDFLTWDSKFFGFNIGRVHSHTLSAALIEKIDNWSIERKIRCLYFLCVPDDWESTYLAELHGFQFVDVRITFELQISDNAIPILEELRHARMEEIPLLENFAQTGFKDSRFFFDPGFPREQVEALYAVWVRRDYQDNSTAVLVTEAPDIGLAGYITCSHKTGQDFGRIGLVGVSRAGRGRGIGQTLVKGAVSWVAKRGATRLLVVTQGRNIAAQRLYQRCGFLTRSLELWYHKWYGEE